MACVCATPQALYAGESYELCLTTQFDRGSPPRAWDLYRMLRRANPSPYAAWLDFGAEGPQVCCSSPERFLRLERGGALEAKPIKGTAPRGADGRADTLIAEGLRSEARAC